MKKFITFIFIVGASVLFFGCEDDYYIDSGLSNGVHEVSMWEYLATDSYNWDSTRLVISRAGLEDVFKGENSAYSKITFFGVTNHSIRKYMLDNSYASVADIPVETCREYILSYVVAEQYLWDEIDFEVKGTTTGGTDMTNANGGDLRVFRRKSNYGSVVDAGPVSTFVQSLTANKTVQAVATNIQTNTGVVHALSYTHPFGPF